MTTFPNPYADTADNRRAAFATRRGTPAAVVEARAAAARRLGLGYFSAESRAARARNAARFEQSQRDAERADAALRVLFSTPGAVTWLVGVNHDTPVGAYLRGDAGLKLCMRPDCCNGVLETAAQRDERIAHEWAERERAQRDGYRGGAYVARWDDDADDLHYLGWKSGLS